MGKKSNGSHVKQSKCTESNGGEKDCTDSQTIDSEVSPSHTDSTTPASAVNKKKILAKTRYVVFVGNLSFSLTESDIRNHFVKAGDIVDIRLATDRQKSFKGFAFVELKDKMSYEKALSLNHTFLGGRRINVEYTDKSSNKKLIKKKNLKLQAMRKAGKLQGSVKSNQKRSVRRAKARKAGNKLET
ncbi:hypothetical protein RI129_008790 [Pyrocoelia pectoralis]|uniref:RRM domain-containing protein n=1 Tax=Pyrocoelia pectoralis TaxID=417401 RepID=A0AAN7ZKF6_9COLE